jgi:hypothetical protein
MRGGAIRREERERVEERGRRGNAERSKEGRGREERGKSRRFWIGRRGGREEEG